MNSTCACAPSASASLVSAKKRRKIPIRLEKFMRLTIYSYLVFLDLYKMTQLSKNERAIILSSEIVYKPREMRQFGKYNIVNCEDINNMKFLFDFCTKLPTQVRIYFTYFNLSETLQVYSNCFQKDPSKIEDSFLEFRINRWTLQPWTTYYIE